MRRPLSIALALAAFAVGCGGDEETTAPGTITVSTSVPTSATATTTTTAQPAADADEAGGKQGEAPEPGSGAGAANAVIAAAAVLTRDGTPQQACGSFVTEAFIRTSYGGEQNCIEARRQEALARSITIEPGDDESSTRIVVVPKGGPYDGARVEVDLIEPDGGFQVDSLKAHVPAGP